MSILTDNIEADIETIISLLSYFDKFTNGQKILHLCLTQYSGNFGTVPRDVSDVINKNTILSEPPS